MWRFLYYSCRIYKKGYRENKEAYATPFIFLKTPMTLLFDLDEDQEEEDLSEDDVDTDKADEEKTISIEEFKKFQSDKEKGVQKLIQKQKAMDYAVDNLWEITDNPEHLLTVYEKNKQSGDYILKKYYWGISIDEYKKTILKKEDVEVKWNDVDIRNEIRREFEDREIKKFLKDFKKNISHHDDDVQEKILSEYEDYIEGKKELDADKAKKYAYRAYQDIVWSKFDDTRNIASIMWVWQSKSSSWKKTDQDEAINEFKSVMHNKFWRTFKEKK